MATIAENYRGRGGLTGLLMRMRLLPRLSALQKANARPPHLRIKILAFSFGLVALLTVSDLTIDTFISLRNDRQQAADELGDLTVRFAASLSAKSSPFASGDLLSAAKIMNIDTAVDDVYIIDLEGDVLAESHEKGEGNIGRPLHDVSVLRAMIVRKPITAIENQIATSIAPLSRNNGDLDGYVVLRKAIGSDLEDEFFEALIPAAVLLIIGSAIAIWFSFYLTRPIMSLSEAATRIASGDLGQPVKIESGDEFESLGHALNQMMLQTSTSMDAYRATQSELEEALHKAEAGSRAKSEFLAGMSHELRTPLNAIIGFSDLLTGTRAGALPEIKAREYARDINHSGRHLLTLVSDILDYALLDSGRMELSEGQVDISGMIRSLVAEIRANAEASGVTINIDGNEALPLVSGDGDKLRRALGNILSNAIRYTPAGGYVAISQAIGENGALIVKIIDDGAGFSARDTDDPAVPFGSLGRKASVGGTRLGLGLPLARKVIALHQGELCIESVANFGTTVTVYLPASRRIETVIDKSSIA